MVTKEVTILVNMYGTTKSLRDFLVLPFPMITHLSTLIYICKTFYQCLLMGAGIAPAYLDRY